MKKTNQAINNLTSQVSVLSSNQIDIRNDIKELDDKVSKTYQLALDAWGTSTENRHWLEQAN